MPFDFPAAAATLSLAALLGLLVAALLVAIIVWLGR
jgi:hypothetical protein